MPVQHAGLPVAGYQPQSATKVAIVNENKMLEERVLRQVDAIMEMNDSSISWVRVARQHIEEGFMALNRAVFQPSRIALPEDAA
jgi:hypothetical protein